MHFAEDALVLKKPTQKSGCADKAPEVLEKWVVLGRSEEEFRLNNQQKLTEIINSIKVAYTKHCDEALHNNNTEWFYRRIFDVVQEIFSEDFFTITVIGKIFKDDLGPFLNSTNWPDVRHIFKGNFKTGPIDHIYYSVKLNLK